MSKPIDKRSRNPDKIQDPKDHSDKSRPRQPPNQQQPLKKLNQQLNQQPVQNPRPVQPLDPEPQPSPPSQPQPRPQPVDPLPVQADQPHPSHVDQPRNPRQGQPWTPPPAQQQQSSTTAAKLDGKWKQQVGAAKVTWGKLTEDELLKTEGRAQQLAGLVQERYAVSREIAEEQVQEFMGKGSPD